VRHVWSIGFCAFEKRSTAGLGSALISADHLEHRWIALSISETISEHKSSSSANHLPGRNSRPLQLLFFVLCLDAIFKLLFYGLYMPITQPNADYLKHWEAAKAVLAGRTPYFGAPDLYLGFNYPLFTAYLFSYLGFLQFEASRIVWIIGNSLFAIGGAVIAAKWLRPSAPVQSAGEPVMLWRLRSATWHNWAIICLLLTINFQPLLYCFQPANIDPVQYFILMIFAAAFVCRRDYLAGTMLGIAALVKVAPVLLLIPALAVRRWRLSGSFLIALAAYAVILLLTGKWRMEAFLYQDVLQKIGFHYLNISYSTHKILAEIFHPGALADRLAYNHWVFQINLFLLMVMIAVCAYWYLYVRRQVEHLFGFGMLMIILMSPLLEYHHFVWAAPALFFQIRGWAQGSVSNRAILICIFAWVILFFVRIANDFMAPVFSFPYMCFAPAAGVLLAVISAAIACSPPASDSSSSLDSAA
jgi:hypothetical protein